MPQSTSRTLWSSITLSRVQQDEPKDKGSAMNSRRPAIVKNVMRASSGGVALILALIALMFLQGVGDGDGEGESKSDSDPLIKVDASATSDAPASDSSDTDSDNTADSESDTENSADPESGLTADEQKALASDVLGVLTDEYDYYLIVPGDVAAYRPTTLARILELAAQAKGDSNGIRVRIVCSKASRTKTEVDLKAALAGIGVGEDAVYMPKELVPSPPQP